MPNLLSLLISLIIVLIVAWILAILLPISSTIIFAVAILLWLLWAASPLLSNRAP